ncbi:hypothetical protein FCM35_KLT07263 [Carex littledalei]|uniref:Uncharacterized protein n=1 Tax=Carex littledalei TaxID=544730 RepID=A0A833QIG4_9POAL|nr:hypothetical protein FCM35_KLT07263 [Carex littledalei]
MGKCGRGDKKTKRGEPIRRQWPQPSLHALKSDQPTTIASIDDTQTSSLKVNDTKKTILLNGTTTGLASR